MLEVRILTRYLLEEVLVRSEENLRKPIRINL
jgi:hypothetical protein